VVRERAKDFITILPPYGNTYVARSVIGSWVFEKSIQVDQSGSKVKLSPTFDFW
jgi:hypothetical protein